MSSFPLLAVQLPTPIAQWIHFRASHWANGPAKDDQFYQVPDGASKATPGTTLKVEMDTDTSLYLLPSATAMTRFIYQSKDLTGNPVPAFAFILWPYSPKSQADGYAVVAWAHGITEHTVNYAPSNYLTFSYHFLTPIQIAAQGYVVVGTNYAGLGIHKHKSGEKIVHEYLASPSQANDVVYAVQAAQKIFPELSQDFIVIGHSYGGGATWATAQRQVNEPIPGYLGGVAISPVTTILDQPEPYLSIMGASLTPGLEFIFPDFRRDHILAENRRLSLGSALDFLRGGGGMLKSNWRENEHVQRYQAIIANGGKKIAGPLLVIYGDINDKLISAATTAAVNRTAEAFPESQLEYVLIPNVTHVAAIQASQRLWMEWIADRFA